ncbi:hypothetical protein L1987_16703 [Smallanthus sonchifolius]|uniref:Uncharacterized protein n=1 Tax=Smallanthus sonchifolius TaxID=185202 RepID=A0ACB9IUU7_9ASTR|nr:hypothetical protein L1987_16703 [Smallanthus sonchifolius]
MKTKIRVYKPASSQENYHFAQKVGDDFIKKYYKVLHRCPEETYKFYKDESTLSRPRDNGMSSITTIKEIEKEIMQSNMSNATIVLLDMHAQDTIARSVIVTKAHSLPSPNTPVEVPPKLDMQYWGPPKIDTPTEDVPEVLEKDQKHKSSSTKEAFDIERGQVEKNPHPSAEEAEKKESYTTIVGKAISQPVPTLASAQDGYRYAFVEFNNPRAAHQAAGSINFDGWECQVEYKKVRIEGGGDN